jgi:hypothetical protein
MRNESIRKTGMPQPGFRKFLHEDFDLDEVHMIQDKTNSVKHVNMGIQGDGLHFRTSSSVHSCHRPSGTRFATAPALSVKEVLTKKQLRAFIDFPFRLYQKNKYYVPPLKKDIEETFNKKKNPAFEFCEARQWLAYRGDKVVGRIAGIINHAFIDKWKNNYVRFGWMDFEEDAEIAKALLEEVERWARERGMTAVHGPLGFTNFDHAGLLIEGYDQLGTMATLYNYPYYRSYMEQAGYHKDVDWVEYKIKVPREMPEQLEKIADTIEKRYRLRVVRSATMKVYSIRHMRIFMVLWP